MSDIQLMTMKGIAAFTRQRTAIQEALDYLNSINLASMDSVLNDPTWERVKNAADQVANAYRMGNAAETGIAELTREFWVNSEHGRLLSHCYQWLYGDKLISTKKAIFTIYPELDRNKRPAQKYWVMISNNAGKIVDPKTKRPLLTRYWKGTSVCFLLDEVLELKRRKENRIAHEHTGKAPTNAKEYTGFIDPNGNRVTVFNLSKFCSESVQRYGYRLDRQAMARLVAGTYGRGVYKGWTYKGDQE